MAERAPADQKEREAALDVRRSFIVQAPAGSGKTELLVQRYLKLLETVEKPEEIVAITFTKKAAAEMRKRVIEKLSPELAPRLRIQTIDALCAALTRQMPVLAKLGAQPAVAEDASELYDEAAARTLADLTPPVARLLAHLDNNVADATDLLAGMLERRDQWLRKTGDAPNRGELEATLAAERNRLIRNAQALYPQASVELANEVLTQKGEWRKKPKPAPPELIAIPGLREALVALSAAPPPEYTGMQWEALEAILALLKPAMAQMLALFGERGEVDFTQIAHGALLALGTPDEPTDLLLSMDARVRHLLVDEFQDTSNSQWELLERLTAGWEAGDGRTVFVVGDPMQSIYRFRDAQVGLFLHARRAGLPGVKLEPLTLSTNFRSQAKIVEWANEVFPRVLPTAEDEASGAVPYSPSVLFHEATLDGEPTLETFSDRDGEAQRVVELVKTAQGKTAILVRNRSHLDAIVPALKDAGIRFRAVEIEQLGEKQVVQDLYALTRALTHLADRVAWLAILRAPWCGLDLKELLDLCAGGRPEAPSPSAGEGWAEGGGRGEGGRNDRTIWELMQEPRSATTEFQQSFGAPSPPAGQGNTWGGAEGRGQGNTWSAAEGDRQDPPRLAHMREVLAPALGNRLRGTLRDRVEGVWLALGGPACVEDVTDLEDAEIFLDELDRLEEAGELTDFSALGTSLKKLYALPDVNAGLDAVEIMTIHKAKGLEFDTVIVPGLDRPRRSGRKPLFAWRSLPSPSGTREHLGRSRGAGGEGAGETGLLLAPIDETGGDKEPLYQYVRNLDKQAEDIEAGRLLYVAATRAESRLHLLACLKVDEDGVVKMPSRRSLLGIAWGALSENIPLPTNSEAKSGEAGRLPGDRLRRLPLGFSIPAVPDSTIWRSPLEGREDAAQIEFSWVGETARHMGTVVHAWLRRIADDELKGWDAARVAQARIAVRGQLSARGVSGAELEAAAERVLEALRNAITDQKGRWVLGSHPEANSEFRIRTRDRNYVIDRVFNDAQGTRWIVDYKTSTHTGADVEGFLDREQQRYAAQLQRYASALDREARCGLYFPILAGWREILR
ncbi:MAG: UvrD-helicase domain-containing protein [Betaproteobacteria bacterium]|nr:UvrD-helicase domain-containing protein [Betaproteobacteria bacterium]